MKTKITDYYIDDNKTLHTYIGNLKHVTISDVKNDKQAKRLIKELQDELNDRELEKEPLCIYESPNGGKTIYKRESLKIERTKIIKWKNI